MTLLTAYPNISGGSPGSFTNVTVTGSTIPTNGLYLPAANTVGIATNGTLRVSVSTSLVTLATGIGLTLTDGDATLSEGKLTITDTANESALTVTSSATTTNAVSIIADSLTAGQAFRVYSNSADATARYLVRYVNDNAASSGTVAVGIQQDAANYALDIAQNGNSTSVRLVTAGSTTNGMQIVADALTTGFGVIISSNSTNTGAFALANLINDNTSATGAYCLRMQQDAANAFMNLVGTAAGTTTDPISTLTTPGATYGFAQIDINGAKKWIQVFEDPS